LANEHKVSSSSSSLPIIIIIIIIIIHHYHYCYYQGVWNKDVGGNREMGTWFSNPKIKFKIKGEAGKKVPVFVGLYIRDSRLTMGFDYFKDPLYATPLGFDIITKEAFGAMESADKRKEITKGFKNSSDNTALSQPGTPSSPSFLPLPTSTTNYNS